MTAGVKLKFVGLMLTGLIAICGFVVSAQEMEPRAYSRAPVRSNFVLFSYAYQNGDVLFDSSLPLRDVRVKLNLATIAFGHTFGLAGKQANISVLAPYLRGRVSGTV